MKKLIYIVVAIVLLIGSVTLYTPASADVSSPSYWNLTKNYLMPIGSAYGIRIPGLATSTTGCLSVSATGWISASGSACGTGSAASSTLLVDNNTWGGTNTFAYTATTTIGNFGGSLDAAAFPGADMGAKINAAYAALPSTGGVITVPNGTHDYTTPIVFNVDNKFTLLRGGAAGGASNNSLGGTTLNYTPSTGDAITFGTNDYIVGHSGLDGIYVQGGNGTTARTSRGIVIGGTNGGFNLQLKNGGVSGFGKGLAMLGNVSFPIIENFTIHFNGRNIDIPDTAGANCENYRMNNSTIADSNNQAGGATDLYSLYIQESGNCQLSTNSMSWDDGQLFFDQYGGVANIWNSVEDHHENPNRHQYSFVESIAAASNFIMNKIGGDSMNDVVTGMPEFYKMAGTANLIGHVVDGNSDVTTPVTRVVNALASSTQINWFGLVSKGAGATYVYGQAPMSPMGIGSDYGPPSFIVATNTSSAAGLVGIGVWSPSAKLSIASVGSATPGTNSHIQMLDSAALRGWNLRLDSTTDYNLNFDAFYNSGYTSKVTLGRVTGNLGVGTTSPWAKLSVEGNASIGGQLLASYVTATSTTPSSFAGGLTSYASSTIGAGATSTGLTVFGGATTTGPINVNGVANPRDIMSVRCDSALGGLGLYFSNNASFPAIRGVLCHGGNTGGYNAIGGLQIVAQGASQSTLGSGAIHFMTPTGNSGGSGTDATVADRLTILQNGNIGVGSTTPMSLLAMEGTQPAITLHDETGREVSMYANAGTLNFNTAGGSSIIWNQAGVERMRLLGTNNNLGIGTSSPYAKLSVVGPIVAEYIHATGTATSTFGGSIQFSGSAPTGGQSQIYNTNANTGIRISGTSLVEVNVNGATLLSIAGTTISTRASSAIVPLTPNTGSIGSATAAYQNGYFSNTVSSGNFAATSSTATSTFAGGLGVGTTSPYTALDVNGTITQSTVKSCTLGLTTDALGSITGCVTSDERLKTAISSAGDLSAVLMGLNPVTYLWNDLGKKTMGKDADPHAGFIAQQVEKVFPQAVVSGSNGYKAVDPNAILAVVVSALQKVISHQAEQDQHNEAQDAEIAALRAEIAALKAQKSQPVDAVPCKKYTSCAR